MKKIRLSKSTIGPEEKEAVLQVLGREYLGMGEEVRLFEEELQRFLGTKKEVVCVNTGTAALHLALQCLGIGPGDEVIVPTITYIASFQAISATGATAVPCDVDPRTLFMDVDDARKRITERTKALMPVHYASDAPGLDRVYELSRQQGLRVVEDAAHAFGTLRNGKLVGVEGDILCFSFDGIKNITSGEGGAVVSDDQELLRRVKDARLLGVEKDTEKRYLGQRSWEFDVSHQGFRYHMSNIMAAIGRVQLNRMGAIAERRRSLVSRYLEGLTGLRDLEFLQLDYDKLVPHIFVIKVGGERRDGLRQCLIDNGIECGIHYIPNHLLSKYRVPYTLPAAEAMYARILTLPLHLDLSINDLDRVISVIRNYLR